MNKKFINFKIPIDDNGCPTIRPDILHLFSQYLDQHFSYNEYRFAITPFSMKISQDNKEDFETVLVDEISFNEFIDKYKLSLT
jgi:hypothetical protein